MKDEEAIAAIRRGGREAESGLRTLYSAYGQQMLRFFIFQGASEEEAKDVLQETFIKIFRSAGTYEGSGSARAWVWQVARNCLLDAMRAQNRRLDHETAVNDEKWKDIAGTVAAADTPTGHSVEDCVSNGLEQFARAAPERALALTLYMEGVSMEEIGHQLGRTAAATKEFLYQTRKKVQPFVQRCVDLLGA